MCHFWVLRYPSIYLSDRTVAGGYHDFCEYDQLVDSLVSVPV